MIDSGCISGQRIFIAFVTFSEIPNAVAYTRYFSHKGNSTNVLSFISVSLFKKLYNPRHFAYSSSPNSVNNANPLLLLLRYNPIIDNSAPKQIKPKNSRKKIFKIAVAMDEIKKKKKQTLEKMDRVRRLFEKISIIDKLLDKLMN